jgi:GT2 family glycosyltransferase
MHRSGTSAMTRVLNLLGADLPRKLIPAIPGNNDAGFWESAEIVEIHEKLLASAGSSWDDLSPFPESWYASPGVERFTEGVLRVLERDFSESSLFVLKDPRASKLVPFTLTVLRRFAAEPLFVIMVRHPLEVAASLKARDGFLPAKSLLLWLWHLLESERHTRGQRRTFVSYERLLDDWRSVVRTVADELGIGWPAFSHETAVRIESFLSHHHRHSAFDRADLDAREDVVSWVKRAYAVLCDAGAAAGISRVFDGICTELGSADLAFGPLIADARLTLAAREREIERLRSEAAIAVADAERLRVEVVGHFNASGEEKRQLAADLRVREDELAAQAQRVQQLEREGESKDREIARLRNDITGRDGQLAAARLKIQRLEKRLAQAQGSLAYVLGSKSWQLTKPLRLLQGGLRDRRAMRSAVKWAYWAATFQAPRKLRTRRARAIIEEAGLFDRKFYVAQGRDAAETRGDPLGHYIKWGAAEGRDPHPLFDISFYLEQIPALAQGDSDPLTHYLTTGAASGLDPHPLFDSSYYAHEAACDPTHVNPLVHFLTEGAFEGRNPNPFFDTSYYLETNGDVRQAGMNPLVHFVQAGAVEGRAPNPFFDVEGFRARMESDATLSIDLLRRYTRGRASSSDEDYERLMQHVATYRERRQSRFVPTPPPTVGVAEGEAIAVIHALTIPYAADPQVSIVIPVHNKLELTAECLLSVSRHTDLQRAEIIVVDDASSAAVADAFGSVQNLIYVRNETNLGFLRSCNRGADHARGDFLLFLNNDTQVTEGWLDALLATFSSGTDVGLAGPKLIYPNGRLQEAGAVIERDGTTRLVGLFGDPNEKRYTCERSVDYCSGACVLVPRATFAEIGGFDTRFSPGYCEDVDLCLKIRRSGKRVVYNPRAVVIHHLSASHEDAATSKLPRIATNQQVLVEAWQEEIDRLNDVRLIAFYLPQYHPIPENDLWWGKGFTDWLNVSRARPNFQGHDQPKFPTDLGFYDLRNPEVLEQQAEVAARYGISGFCFYYYRFGNKRLLDRPVEQMVALGRPRFPFCVAWANENWTRTWDGRESDVLIAQEYSDEAIRGLIRDVVRYFEQPNYIRVNGKPLFLVYRAPLLPDVRRVVELWREECRAVGIGEIYLAMVQSFELGFSDIAPSHLGFDAAVEFPPHNVGAAPSREGDLSASIPDDQWAVRFQGFLYDYQKVALTYMKRDLPNYTLFRGVMPRWDNTARRQERATIFLGSSPGAYRAWLETAIEDVRLQNFGDERIVFINAWNEWAEGAYLEPDATQGHAYLRATKNALDRWLVRPPAS